MIQQTHLALLLPLHRIEKLEKEISLSIQCRKNSWPDVCGELKEYEKVLEAKRRADSKCLLVLHSVLRCTVTHASSHYLDFSFLLLEMNLEKQLVKIQIGVKKFQRQLIDVKPTPECQLKLLTLTLFLLFYCNWMHCNVLPFCFCCSDWKTDRNNVRGGSLHQCPERGAMLMVTGNTETNKNQPELNHQGKTN